MTAAPDLSPLSVPTPDELHGMTFPAYRHLLALRPAPRHPELGEVRQVRPFGWVAHLDGRLAGLALAEAPLDGDGDGAEPQLLSLFVRPESRRQGIATALVGAVEETARRQGHRRLAAVYTTGKPAIAWVERIFAARGWERPRTGSVVAQFAPEDAFASDRYRPALLRSYRRGLEIFPWSELAAAELEAIRRSNDEQPWIMPALVPWQFSAAELDASSVGARYQGRIVGWVLNHRLGTDQVRWSISYMHPRLARRGKVLALYHASLSRLVEEGVCRLCTFTTPITNHPHAAFARRWIGAFARSIEESRLVGISLDAAVVTQSRQMTIDRSERSVLG